MADKHPNKSAKVGDSPEAARQVGGKGDFGVKESDRVERDYASRAAKHQDPGAMPEHARGDGVRTSGVGGNESGVGSSSGGDIDTDIIGVGTGGSGVAASGVIHRPPGPDDSDGSSNEFAAPGPKGHPDTQHKGHVGGATTIKGTTHDRSGGDANTTASGKGSAAVSNPVPDDDAFTGEISNDEAAGMDNSPSDNR